MTEWNWRIDADDGGGKQSKKDARFASAHRDRSYMDTRNVSLHVSHDSSFPTDARHHR